MKFLNYNHVVPIQVRFSDIDLLGHVNNACYHNYIELSRVDYFKKVLGNVINWKKQGFVLARTEMDHIKELFLNDEIYCFTRVHHIGTKSIGMTSSIVKKTDDGLVEAAAVKGVLVAMDYTAGQSMEVPKIWRELLMGFDTIG